MLWYLHRSTTQCVDSQEESHSERRKWRRNHLWSNWLKTSCYSYMVVGQSSNSSKNWKCPNSKLDDSVEDLSSIVRVQSKAFKALPKPFSLFTRILLTRRFNLGKRKRNLNYILLIAHIKLKGSSIFVEDSN